MHDQSNEIASKVKEAFKTGSPLNISAAGTKSFLGRINPDHEPLKVGGHSGIVDYDPAELVLVARSGTRLLEIEQLLSEKGQMLGFEPPFIASGATLGGAVASGLSGPARAYSGAVRDFVLGAKFVNGKGEVITVGGKVMKNVAGFDLFRPMAGSMGTLAVLLEVSLRLIPKPATEKTILYAENNESNALEWINLWSGKTQSVSAATWDGQMIRLRLSGTRASVQHDQAQIGAGQLEDELYWDKLNNFSLDFFQQPGRLWRISVPAMSPRLDIKGTQLLDWGGAQRWIKTSESPQLIRSLAARLGGHAECFAGDPDVDTYHPMEANMLSLSRRFKAAFDPAGILNPGRMYTGL